MRIRIFVRFWGISALLSCLFFVPSCSSYTPKKNEVKVHELSDAEMLNPICYTDASAGYILPNIFQSLLAIDFKTLELVPVLAQSRPLIEKIEGGKLKITYSIRKEAKWDNGTPVTPKDVEFTIKVIKNPKVNNQHVKPYYEFIEDFVHYPDDPQKFTLLCKETYILAEASSGDYGILPIYAYDPKGLMSDFTIPQLNSEKDKLANDPKINEFATDFNSEKRQREKDFIIGSGAYKLESWTTGQQIVLEKKKDWWGDALKEVNSRFQANATKLVYKTINDMTSAIVALKAGNVDVMYGIKPKDFVDLPNSDKIKENFVLHTPPQLAYLYFGINLKNPKFGDKKTRQALAYLVDADKMIQTVYYGLAERVVGFIHPSNKKNLNTDLKPRPFDPEKAKQLLAEAGWKDSNGDGTLDNTINGKREDFSIIFSINQGNDMRKAMALMFQEEARKVGIKVDVVPQDWAVFLDNLKNHNFEMYCGSWIGTPTPNDPKQIYHSESSLNGSNYVSFGTPESDAVIDSIRVELDEDKRAALYKKLQAILYDEVSYIYLFAPTERIAIHKRFSNAETSVMRPGFWEAGFQLAGQE
ncbi:MAG: ABC transporter substrate-binding protein [Bacteroidota bacterium]